MPVVSDLADEALDPRPRGRGSSSDDSVLDLT